jgi:hypothetical protein
MIDTETQQRILVHTEGTGGPYIMVPIDQVGAIKQLLQDKHVSFWVDTDAISLDGNPAISVVNLGRGADVARIQQLLDAAN